MAVLVHLPAVDNYFDNDDAWNYVLEAELASRGDGSAFHRGGGYLVYQNLHRLIPDASWIPRWALFDLWMPGWKFPSILLHALNSVLLALLVRRLVDRAAPALLAGLLAAAAPLHPHTVSWIGGTYDLVLGAFALGALLAFLDRRTWLASVLGLCAAMSKEHGVLVAPVLALAWLCFHRSEGWRRGALRLLPLFALTGLLVLVRQWQQAAVGGGLDPMAAVRTVAFDPLDLAFKVPLATFAGLGFPLREALSLDTLTAGLLTGALLAGGLLTVRPLWKSLVPVFLILTAFAFIAPAAAMREYGQALTLDLLIHNARYLYVGHLFAIPLVAVALVGLHETISPTRRVMAVASLVLCLVTVTAGVFHLTVPEPAARQVVAALRESPGPAGRHVWIVNNVYRESSFRAVLSRWLAEHTGTVYHWVQRGAWRVIERRPDKTDGLDFMDGYILARRRLFDPAADVDEARGDRVYLLADRGPSGGHGFAPVALPAPGLREKAIRDAVDLDWKEHPTALSFSTEKGGPDGWTFALGSTADWPQGYAHRPLVSTSVVVDPARTIGLRITYTGTAPARRLGFDRAFEKGYLELHWGNQANATDADRLDPDETFVVLPLQLDGQRQQGTVWLDIDPVFRAAKRIDTLGIHPIDRPGQITIHKLELLISPPPAR